MLKSLHRALIASAVASLAFAANASAGSIVVDAPDDNGLGTECELREAIATANLDTDTSGCVDDAPATEPDDISFDDLVFVDGAETVSLVGTAPQISSTLKITGLSVDPDVRVVLDGDGSDTVLRVDPGVVVDLTSIDITGGAALLDLQRPDGWRDLQPRHAEPGSGQGPRQPRRDLLQRRQHLPLLPLWRSLELARRNADDQQLGDRGQQRRNDPIQCPPLQRRLRPGRGRLRDRAADHHQHDRRRQHRRGGQEQLHYGLSQCPRWRRLRGGRDRRHSQHLQQQHHRLRRGHSRCDGAGGARRRDRVDHRRGDEQLPSNW